MQYGINLYWLHGKYQEKMKRSVSQLFMILEGSGGMDKSKKENIYLALFLMFLEFITLKKKKNQSYPAGFLIERGASVCSFIFSFIYLPLSSPWINLINYSDKSSRSVISQACLHIGITYGTWQTTDAFVFLSHLKFSFPIPLWFNWPGGMTWALEFLKDA